jgi:predicted  nucleic acid-binding Zn-ribbon protein
MTAAEIKEQFEFAKQGLKAIRDKNSTARQAAEQGNQAIISEINDINDKIAKIKELVARSNNLDTALKAKEDELENLNKERGELNKEFDDVKQERDRLQQQLKETEDNLQNVNAIVVTRDEEVREKNNALEDLQREMFDERRRLEGVNQDLQDLLADITQVNREINETDGEVQTLNQYNQETVENIKALLQKVNTDLNDILTMPQPPASRMQQIHQDRVTSRAENENTDSLGDEGLGGLFDEDAAVEQARREKIHNERVAQREGNQAAADNVDDLGALFPEPDSIPAPAPAQPSMVSSQDKAVEEASKEPWWNTLNPPEQATYRRVPEQRSVLRQEGNKRLQEQADKAGIESTWNESDPEDGFYDNFSDGESVSGKWDPPSPAAPAPSSKPIYLPGSSKEWTNMMTPDEMNLFNRDPSKRSDLEAEGKRRLAERKKSVGGRRTRRRKAGSSHHAKTHKKGGYVAVYKKSSRRSSSKSKKTRSKRSSSKSSKRRKSRKH